MIACEYRARRADGSIVAVKVMLSRVDADDEASAKFKRETAITAKLDHPKIVRVTESGASGAVCYFIMEFCDGGSAWDLMLKNKGRLSLAQAKPIILGALDALAFAHEKDSFIAILSHKTYFSPVVKFGSRISALRRAFSRPASVE